MKRLNILFLYAMLLTYLLTFVSCGDTATQYKNLPYKSSDGFIYNGNFYFLKNDTIEYISLSDESAQTVNLCSDPLCNHSDKTCPNYYEMMYGVPTMVIDEAESNKNKFYPVFYVSTYNNGSYQIVKFDSKNNIRDVVIDNIANPILQIWLFNDNIFYLCSEGEDGQNIYISNKYGTVPKKLDNSEKMYFWISGITDNSIIFCDYEGNIYMSPHDLSTKTYICNSVSRGNAYIFNNKLFFAKDLKVAKQIEGYNFLSCDIYYIDLGDINMSPILAIKDVSYIAVPAIFQSYNLLFYCMPNDISLIKSVFQYDPIQEKTIEVKHFKDGTSTIYSYNILNNKSNKIIGDTNELMSRFIDADDTYFIYNGYSYDIDTIGPTHITIYNYKNGSKKIID